MSSQSFAVFYSGKHLSHEHSSLRRFSRKNAVRSRRPSVENLEARNLRSGFSSHELAEAYRSVRVVQDQGGHASISSSDIVSGRGQVNAAKASDDTSGSTFNVTISSLNPVANPTSYVVLIHGLNGDQSSLESLGESIEATYTGTQVLLVDWSDLAHRGVVGAPVVERNLSNVAAQIASQLKAAGYPPAKVILFGYSYGGDIALDMVQMDNYPASTIGMDTATFETRIRSKMPSGQLNLNLGSGSPLWWQSAASSNPTGQTITLPVTKHPGIHFVASHKNIIQAVRTAILGTNQTPQAIEVKQAIGKIIGAAATASNAGSGPVTGPAPSSPPSSPPSQPPSSPTQTPPYSGTWSGSYEDVAVIAQSPVFQSGSLYATYSGSLSVTISSWTRSATNPSNPSTDILAAVTSATVTMSGLDNQTITFTVTAQDDSGDYNFEYFGADNELPNLILLGYDTVITSLGTVQDSIILQGDWVPDPAGNYQDSTLTLTSIAVNVWGPDVPNWYQAGAFLSGGWTYSQGTADQLGMDT
jgi:pimeloyl-ACP methyl ester carboxylesterase